MVDVHAEEITKRTERRTCDSLYIFQSRRSLDRGYSNGVHCALRPVIWCVEADESPA
jgi:hypothetical protein